MISTKDFKKMISEEGRSTEKAKTGDSVLGPFAELPGEWSNGKDLNGRGWNICLLYTSPSPRDKRQSRMPSSA